MRLEDWLKYVEQVEKGELSAEPPGEAPSEKKEDRPAPGTPEAVQPGTGGSPVRPAQVAIEGPASSAAVGTGSLFETREVLVRPVPAPAASAPVPSPPPPVEAGDVDIPEIEEFLPFLKDSGTSAPPEPAAPAQPVEKKPASPPPALDAPGAPAAGGNGISAPQSTTVAREPVDQEAPAAPALAGEEQMSATAPSGTAAVPGGNAVAPSPQNAAAETAAPAAPAGEEAAPPAARPAAQKPRKTAPAPPRKAEPVQQSPADAEEDAGEPVWNRLPAHLQAFASMQVEEVAQRSYKRGFRESRQELLARLLDPPLSLEEAARILNVCPTTVRRYTNRGLLPHFRTAGNQRRFRFSDIVAFMESQQNAGRRRRAKRAQEEAEGPDD